MDSKSDDIVFKIKNAFPIDSWKFPYKTSQCFCMMFLH